MPSFEYKLTKSAGVTALRRVGMGVSFGASGANVVSQKFEGVAVDDRDVYRTTFTNGKVVLTDETASTTSVYWLATKIEGGILYADATNTIAINVDHILYSIETDLVSFDADGNGSIDGTAQGYRYYLADGTKIVAIPEQLL